MSDFSYEFKVPEEEIRTAVQMEASYPTIHNEIWGGTRGIKETFFASLKYKRAIRSFRKKVNSSNRDSVMSEHYYIDSLAKKLGIPIPAKIADYSPELHARCITFLGRDNISFKSLEQISKEKAEQCERSREYLLGENSTK